MMSRENIDGSALIADVIRFMEHSMLLCGGHGEVGVVPGGLRHRVRPLLVKRRRAHARLAGRRDRRHAELRLGCRREPVVRGRRGDVGRVAPTVGGNTSARATSWKGEADTTDCMISFSSATRLRMTQVCRELCSGSCLSNAIVFCNWLVSPIRAFPAAGLVTHEHACWTYCSW